MSYEYIDFTISVYMLIGPSFVIGSIVIWKIYDSHGNINKIISVLLFVLGAIITLVDFYRFYDYKRNVVEMYKNGNYLIVEGAVIPKDMDNIPNGYDEFTINGITFEIGQKDKPGLQTKYYYGGPLTGDNQTVKICYVTYKGENFIMKLEIIDSDL